MGVYLDKYFGYMLDVTDEFNDELWNKYVDSSTSDLCENLKEINFIPYYSREKQKVNDITLVYDGIDGDYCKLIFIKQIDRYCDDEFDVSVENEFLKTLPIPCDVRKKLTKVYEIIFGKPNKKLEIHLMKLNHYH